MIIKKMRQETTKITKTKEKIKNIQYKEFSFYVTSKALVLFGSELTGLYHFCKGAVHDNWKEMSLGAGIYVFAKGVSKLLDKFYYIPKINEIHGNINKRISDLEEKVE